MTSTDQLFLQAVTAFNRHDWPQAARWSTQVLCAIPDHAGCLYMMGASCLELQQLAPAVRHLRKAVELVPDRADFIAQLARALSTARLDREAYAVAERARSLCSKDPSTLDTLGKVFEASNSHELAVEMYSAAAELAPNVAHYRYNLATAYAAVGNVMQAESAMESCLLLDPTFWKAHLALAHLRRQSTGSNHLTRLAALIARHEHDHLAKICLHMAMAKELEDLGFYPEAFDHLALGKAESRKDIHYKIEQDEVLFAALHRASPAFEDSIGGHPSSEPIFVFGMPRTGTTLVERILSSHPDVYSTGELQNFAIALRQVWGSAIPLWLDEDIAHRVRGIDWEKVGATYLASTRPATGHTPKFVDKLPHNFLYAGFIARALPNAKMICLRRNPVDTCLSNFRQLFAEKLPYYNYSYDLLDTGRYYLLFDQMMKHWQQVFPDRILELHYEDLIAEQEFTTRRLLDFCGLPWSEACLQFEKNQASVGTASALQVRQPIYSSAVQRWKSYEPQLVELLELLKLAGMAL